MRAVFANADLRGARLQGARIAGAVFDRANLTSADLRGCDEGEVDLSHAVTLGLRRGALASGIERQPPDVLLAV
jgi:uncharacterized protein YjbI with pentapeptide repeats